MTVLARGYRSCPSARSHVPGWWVVLEEQLRVTTRSRGMRILGTLFLLWTVMMAVLLYVQVGTSEALRNVASRLEGTSGFTLEAWARRSCLSTLTTFYGGVTGLVSLLAIFTGAGLVSDDLRTRALTLYLVRPLSAFDYALGKALVLPYVLITRTAAPGAVFWLLAGAWLPPGHTWSFWSANLDLLAAVGEYTLLASGLYAGLLLLVSPASSRRAVVSSIAAAVLFGGLMVHGVAARMQGLAGEVLRLASVPSNAVTPFLWLTFEEELARRGPSRRTLRLEMSLPDAEGVAWMAGLLFLAGLLRTWWRARSVEVTE